MKIILYFCFTAIFVCACQPTPMPASDSAVNGVPSSPGSTLVPSTCSGGKIATTAGGCVVLNKVNLFATSMNYTFIGYTRYVNSDAVLLERVSGAFKVWDLYSLPDSNQVITSLVPICSLTKPAGYYDSFGALNFSGGLFHTIAIDVSGVTRLYDISPVTCAATAGLALQLTYDSCSNRTDFLIFDGSSYVYSFNCSLFKQANANLALASFGTRSIAGYGDSPLESTSMTLNPSGNNYWFMAQSNPRLWRTDSTLTPDAWFALPTATYSELFSVSGITWATGNHIHVLTMQNQIGLKVFDFDLTNFSGGQP